MTSDAHELDQELRKEYICRGCGQAKEYGQLCCWACWRGGNDGFKPNGVQSLKYFDGTLAQWVALVEQQRSAIT